MKTKLIKSEFAGKPEAGESGWQLSYWAEAWFCGTADQRCGYCGRPIVFAPTCVGVDACVCDRRPGYTTNVQKSEVDHVMNRGDRREPIFRDEEDRRRFITTLGEACVKAGWQVHNCALAPRKRTGVLRA
jgi:hypothetical protein